MLARGMHGRVARALGFVFVSACGSRTVSVGPDAAPTGDSSGGSSCAVACDGGSVCIHEYYTHDPPPPLTDGGMCTSGTQRFDRCWSVTDRCGALPQGCVLAGASCSCPPLGPPSWPEGCACHGDGTLDCYSIGK
ncbi:MAG TPA: hypothetical protein VF765_12770 [Polyangiaceae bacterium]